MTGAEITEPGADVEPRKRASQSARQRSRKCPQRSRNRASDCRARRSVDTKRAPDAGRVKLRVRREILHGLPFVRCPDKELRAVSIDPPIRRDSFLGRRLANSKVSSRLRIFSSASCRVHLISLLLTTARSPGLDDRFPLTSRPHAPSRGRFYECHVKRNRR
jgi:hypothetical protein